MSSTSFQEEWDRSSITRKNPVAASVVTSTLEAPVHFHALLVSEEQLKTIENKRVRQFYKVSI
jgi:hypothetical protein